MMLHTVSTSMIIGYLISASVSIKIAAFTVDSLPHHTRRSNHRGISFQLQARSDRSRNVNITPQHSALAQVLANQYGFDISAVQPSSKQPGAKITAADVEYHAWKISQPPCISDALEVAYSLGLDLNELYDDDDREYVMNMADIQLYTENSRSLRMSSQVKKKNIDNEPTKKMKKMKALDKRVEQNVEKLTYTAMQAAMTVTDGIVQQVQSQILKGVQNSSSELGKDFMADMKDKNNDEIVTVADFDLELAIEIQEALSIAEEPMVSFQPDDQQNKSNGAVVGDGYDMEELRSMTCTQLKDELRQRGMKISGKKAELVDRLLYWADPV